MTVNMQEVSRDSIKFGPCDKCGAKKRKVCTSGTGAPYNHGVVHAVRRDAYLAAHPEVLDQANQPFEASPETQAAVNEAMTTRTPFGIMTIGEYQDAMRKVQERDERVRMVRGVFTMLSNLYGPTQTLDMLASLFVEYDIDETVLWQSNRDPSA